MRKFTLLMAFFLGLTLSIFAQAPQGIKYQAVVRSTDGNIVRSQAVGMQFKIHQTFEAGAVVYTETFATTSNTYGLVVLEIGTGTSSDDFSSIDWASGPYFVETLMDITGGTDYVSTGTNQFLSTPYSLYSNSSAFADSADYNSLLNKPTTITQEQINKVDSITVTQKTDLDLLAADVSMNKAKVSFPGFGTVPGKALEGDQVIWIKADTNIFYNSGNVGIAVSETSDFGGSKLHVGGGILYDGIPQTKAPGLLYYDTVSTGSFHFVDDENNDIALGGGAISYTDTLWKLSGPNNFNVYTEKNANVIGSLGIGHDIITNESFGFSNLRLKENNLRILFDDSDEPGGSMPANDWQIEINSTNNGGTNHFAIKDVTAERTPFKIMGGAPENSLYVASSGNVGIGTNLPTVALEVNGDIKATHFIGDGSGLTGITGATGGVSDADTLVMGADTDNNNVGEIALQTKNVTRLTLTNDGKVGIGTTSPSTQLEVIGGASFQNLQASGNISAKSILLGITTEAPAAAGNLDYDVAGKSIIAMTATASQDIQGFVSGVSGQEITFSSLGVETLTIKHNGTGTQKILLSGATDIVLEQYESARFICDGTAWYCIGLNN